MLFPVDNAAQSESAHMNPFDKDRVTRCQYLDRITDSATLTSYPRYLTFYGQTEVAELRCSALDYDQFVGLSDIKHKLGTKPPTTFYALHKSTTLVGCGSCQNMSIGYTFMCLIP